MNSKVFLVISGMIAACLVAVLLGRGSRDQTDSQPVETSAAEGDAQAAATSAGHGAGQPVLETSERKLSGIVRSDDRRGLENDPVEILARINAVLASTNDCEMVFTNLLPALVGMDPLAAARFAETNILGEDRERTMHCVARLWAAQDAISAAGWAATLTNAIERDAILTEVCRKVAENDPAEAVRMRSESVADSAPNTGLETLAQTWAESDFPAAQNWVLSRTQTGQRDQIVARLAYVRSKTSPLEAAGLVVGSIPPGEAQTEAAMSVLHQWAARDLAAAQSWAENFPEGDLRSRALKEIDGIKRYASGSP
jgi:hypothetical protein